MEIKLTSTAFKDGETIPARYTCDGDNVSPDLSWSDPPGESMSIVLICDDPDAPSGTFVHWVVFNISPEINSFPANMSKTAVLDNGAIQGTTDYHRPGYGGPCPPSGTHRYYFKIYALDIKLPFDSSATKKTVTDAMKGHIVAKGQLMGRYRRKQ